MVVFGRKERDVNIAKRHSRGTGQSDISCARADYQFAHKTNESLRLINARLRPFAFSPIRISGGIFFYMTILEALQWANHKLKKCGIDSPMIDAEVLLADVLDIPKARLFAHFNDPLKSHQQERFSMLIDRRSKHEPVAYLTGIKSFFGRDFEVNPFVLIPRPTTELLVQEAIKRAVLEEKEETLFVDVGTGSGVIAVSVAAETRMPVIAIDQSAQALSVAQKNAKTYRVDDVIEFRQGNLLDPLIDLFKSIRQTSKKPISSVYPFKQLILCANLPYIKTDAMETLQKDIRLFEPREALEAGPDGLSAYWRLFRQLSRHRDQWPRRLVALIEIDPSQAHAAIKLILHYFPYSHPLVKQDLQGQDRLLIMESLHRNDAEPLPPT